MNSDKKFAYADWQAKTHLEYAPVFYYVFDYMSPDSFVPEAMGQYTRMIPYNCKIEIACVKKTRG